MKEPMRLSDEQPDGFEAELIRAGRRDAPSSAVRRASALASGIAVASAIAPKTSVAASALTTILAAGAKGMLIGTLVTGTIVGVPRLMSARATATARSEPRAAPQPVNVARPSAAAMPPSNDPTPAATGAPEDVPVAAPPQSHVRRVHSEPVTTTQVATTPLRLADEVRAFERARSAFTRGDVTTASSELAAYERAFSRGALSLEAEVLRIEILEARGDRAAASARARAFLEANPSAPAARRVRNLLTQSGSETFR